MDPVHYYKSIALELDALKNRVRFLIADAHWLTDGEWKESVVRALLRRHLPPTIGVGRGFVVDEKRSSRQIDVLLYETSRPILHQEGDLVFVTPDSVKGIIEVKSRLLRSNLPAALESLAVSASVVSGGSRSIFLGLFAFEAHLGAKPTAFLLDSLQRAAYQNQARVVNHVCAGWNQFVRYWGMQPTSGGNISSWYSYAVDKTAPGYFLANALDTAVPGAVQENHWAWFPREGKEIHKTDERSLYRPPSAAPVRPRPHRGK